MKRAFFIFSLLLLAIFYSCNSGDAVAKEPPVNVDKDSANFTTVKWKDTAVNFGTVTKGEKVHIKYTCTNTGDKPLFLYYVRPGCGCTVANYTKAAIMPGKTGEVHKSIIVQTNTTNPSPRLTFSGTVKPGADSTGAKKSS
jgi:hypothetical protein